MAEARSAVTSSFAVTSSEGEIILRINKDAIPAILRATKRFISRKFISIRNSIHNSIFPASPLQWMFSVATPAIILNGSTRYSQLAPAAQTLYKVGGYIPGISNMTPFNRNLTISLAAGTGVFLAISTARRLTLRLLLHYRGWLYEAPKEQTKMTLLWAILVRVFTNSNPMTYSFQNSLPHLPVPKLKDTIRRYLNSVESIQSHEEFETTKKLAADFLANEGPKLQRYLWLKWLVSPNYVTDWWEKYVYLRGRSSIMINSNYYAMDALSWVPTTKQVSRAAGVILTALRFKQVLESEQLEPILIRDTVPLCMFQYERVFQTTRVPGKECDTIEHYENSSYVVVMRKGRYYQLPVFDKKDQFFQLWELEAQISWIMDDAERGSITASEERIAALTSDERHVWAENRSTHFASGINKESLDIIEKAIFVLVLEEAVPESLSVKGKALLHGNCYNRWFDKSITCVIFPDGHAGLNCEHSWADAPVIAHMWEWVFCTEANDRIYDENGRAKRPETNEPRPQLPTPRKLTWEVTPALASAIDSSVVKGTKLIDDLHLRIHVHNIFGKGFIKKAHISPDGFIQLAFQLAYYRDSGKQFALTYESSMTRLYLQGRTETVRSASLESRDFVLAMEDPSCTNEQRIQLLRKAGNVHQNLYRNAMSGKGIDRHLFGLYVVSQGLGVQSPFLIDALKRTWKLSTSQQPQQQTKLWDPAGKDHNRISAGGGFGPVADDGYGVSYMVAGEDTISFHVSSKRSASNTDSDRFLQNIVQALVDIAKLFGLVEKQQ